jgi:hypothetical protein
MGWFSQDRRKRMRVIIKASVALILLAFVLWFPLTWFFFGSVHPCGILAWRLRDRNRDLARLEASIEVNNALADNVMQALTTSARSTSKSKDWDVVYAAKLKARDQEAHDLTPAACLWYSIVWRWDRNKDEGLRQLELMDKETKNWLDKVERLSNILLQQKKR